MRGCSLFLSQACFRGAKAAAELGKHADVLELCAQGLQSASHRRTPPLLSKSDAPSAADAASTDLQRLQAAARAAQAAASATERRVVHARETAERVAVRSQGFALRFAIPD